MQSSAPMHYKDKDGNWLTYNAKLISDNSKEGVYNLAGTDLDIGVDIATGETHMYFSGQTGISFGGSTEIKIIDKDGEIQNNKLATYGKNNSYAKTDRSIVIKDVFDGIDRMQNFEHYKIKTDYIINKRPTFSDNAKHLIFEDIYRLPKGYSIVEDKEFGVRTELGWQGDLIILDENENEVARMHKPVYYDASYDPISICNKNGEKIDEILLDDSKEKKAQKNIISGAYEILYINDGVYKIKLLVPVSWLIMDDLLYPVVIDPDVSSTYSSGNIGSCYYPSIGSATMNISIPAGSTVTQTTSTWQYRALNGQYRNEVYTRIGGNYATYQWYQCSNGSGGYCSITPTDCYDMANGTYPTGVVPITIGITQIYYSDVCSTNYSYIVNSTWSVTVTYTVPSCTSPTPTLLQAAAHIAPEVEVLQLV